MIIDPNLLNLPGWTSIVFDLCSALVVLDCKWQESRQASDIIRSFVAAPSRCAFCRASWRTFAEVLGEKWLQQWPRSYAVRVCWWLALPLFSGTSFLGQLFSEILHSGHWADSSLRHLFSRESNTSEATPFYTSASSPIIIKATPLSKPHLLCTPSDLGQLLSERFLLKSILGAASSLACNFPETLRGHPRAQAKCLAGSLVATVMNPLTA